MSRLVPGCPSCSPVLLGALETAWGPAETTAKTSAKTAKTSAKTAKTSAKTKDQRKDLSYGGSHSSSLESVSDVASCGACSAALIPDVVRFRAVARRVDWGFDCV